MSSSIVVNADFKETRVAILDDWGLSEIYIERKGERGIAGNIYKGRVVKILPGMEAAFVDIGLGRAGFLYVTDVFEGFEMYADILEEEGEIEAEPPSIPRPRKGSPIEDLLTEGQEVVVQVAKEPLGSKGPRLTSHITLPGRYLVLMPTMNHVGVSRRIRNKDERKRLKAIVEKIRPSQMGFIVRTVSEGKGEEDLKQDMDFLLRLWESIRAKGEKMRAPALLYKDLDLVLRAVRDFFSPEVTSLVIDDEDEYNRCLNFAREYLPQLASRIELYRGTEPVFEHYGIEEEINKALHPKVWLKSGGYIVIEETEALTAIDVNTGRYVGKKCLEDTIFRTNLEAAREIAHQIRLRNIGGIIIIDFIDMEEEEHRRQVLETLDNALKKDRYPSNIQGFTELGLVIMTRKRVKESLLKTLCGPCPYCGGRGYMKPPLVVCYDIFREVKKLSTLARGGRISVEVHPAVAKALVEEEGDTLEALEKSLNVKVLVMEKPDFHQEQFQVKRIH